MSVEPRGAAYSLNLHDQAAVDAEYAVQTVVKDSRTHVTGWISRSAAARDEYDHRADVRYGPTLDEYCDIFPSRKPGSPIHVFFHGGYWKLLSAKQHSFLAPVGVENDWTTVVVNYSLCPKVTIREITRQCRAAVAWVHANADTINGDARRIFVSGHSAGGHIVGRLIATRWAEDYGLPADTLAGALPISGLFDLEPLRYSWIQPGVQFTGDDVQVESPIRHLPLHAVPTIVAVGGAETEGFIQQSADYARALRAADLPGEYLAAPGRHHFDVLDDLASADGCLWKALERMR